MSDDLGEDDEINPRATTAAATSGCASRAQKPCAQGNQSRNSQYKYAEEKIMSSMDLEIQIAMEENKT